MEKIAFFDTKPYDKIWFDKLNTDYNIKYIESKLTADTVYSARGCKAVVAFVERFRPSTRIFALRSCRAYYGFAAGG